MKRESTPRSPIRKVADLQKRTNDLRLAKPKAEIRRDFWSLHLPRKTYREGRGYYGTYPEGFVKKVKELGIWGDKVIEPFGGESDNDTITIDINPDLNPDHVGDCREVLKKFYDNFADLILCDPPYDSQATEKYSCPPISIYEIYDDLVRVCKPGGFIGILHTKPPRKPKGTKLHALVAISMGPDRFMRCFQVFQKIGGGD